MAVAKLYDYPYGFKSQYQINPLELELRLFALNWNGNAAYHFKQVAKMLWPEDAKNPVRPFVWHPWAEKMLEKACEYQYLGLSGCASSGKTRFGAIWGLINWLCAPRETMVLATSTSLGDSRRRIWGDIKDYFTYSTLGPGMPGKLVDSDGVILTDAGTGRFSNKEGIALIAGAPGKERDGIAKMIGIKSPKLILLADELPELSPAILDATANLSTQIGEGASFQMIAMGNFKSIYDPFGEFIRPESGYDSITPAMDEWKTERGYCLRFDGLRSPNILAGEDKWPVYGNKQLAEHRRHYPDTSLLFWRMVRSFPCPDGADDVIFSDAHFLQGKTNERVTWAYPPTKVACMDPSFTNGGDRTMVVFGEVGQTTTGLQVLQYYKTKALFENVTLKERTRNFQIAEQFRDLCIAEGVQPEHAGIDASGAGAVLLDIIYELWSRRVLGIQFGGSASELPVNASDMTPSNKKYSNRVTEIWYYGVELLSGFQLRGITPSMAKEMKARKYETVKGDIVRLRVEPKKEMKTRVGFSPDEADAGLALVDLCRQRLSLIASVNRSHVKDAVKAAREEAEAANAVYDSVDYGAQPDEEVYGHLVT